MSTIKYLGLILCGFLSVYFLPVDFLPASLRAPYFEIFGEPPFIPAPESAAVQIPPFDIDRVCPPEYAAWREAQTIDGIAIEATHDCVPDNPWDVAVAVKGTNNVSMPVLMKTLFAPDTLIKGEDKDGDGDPDVIHIRLEVIELNGKSPDTGELIPRFEIAPGVTPGFWVFAPKSRGMATVNFESNEAHRLNRLPAPVIRVEQGDEIIITLENTHYMPHTIHFHGVDHSFKTPTGEGNDGVPLFSEAPTLPGKSKDYFLNPRHAGTMFYHCHVQPQTHILMGLQGMLVVEENRPNNWVQTFNIGGGRVRYRSVAVREKYDREFDLHYLEIDSDLNNRIQVANDPRLISRSIHREYNITQRTAEYYVLNGRSFPYTLRESVVLAKPNELLKLRVLNGGSEGVALHFHGHKPTVTHRDGVALEPAQQIQRDVFSILPAQRIDLALNTINDGLNAYGPGAWLLHDHRERAVTTNGIGPGGGVSLVLYDEYLGERGLPKTVHGVQSLAPLFSPAYFAGELPVFAGMGEGFPIPPVLTKAQYFSARSIAFGVSLVMTLSFIFWIWLGRKR